MKVCVFGLWHLGSVTAACLAAKGIETVGLDGDHKTIAGLSQGAAPLFEPGLDDMLAAGLKSGKLSFATDRAKAVADADIVWVAFDTPVDEEDRADVPFVLSQIESLFPHLKDGAVVLVSSQMPVGSVAEAERKFALVAGGRQVYFACSPENLRLGKAIDVFNNPGRIIVGIRNDQTRARLEPLLAQFCDRLIWISVEAAEMTKHAINAWLATSVTFINEIATLCERSGADASEVELALRSEPRIGQNAYIRPGGAFAGGTLARDVVFLNALAKQNGFEVPLLGGILPSNRQHIQWPLNQVRRKLGNLTGKRVAILGLAYKPGTSAIRRSNAIELLRGLLESGADVTAYDPQVRELPPDLAAVKLAASAQDAIKDADCLVVATEWPEFRMVDLQAGAESMRRPLIVDQNKFLAAQAAKVPGIEFVAIGTPA